MGKEIESPGCDDVFSDVIQRHIEECARQRARQSADEAQNGDISMEECINPNCGNRPMIGDNQLPRIPIPGQVQEVPERMEQRRDCLVLCGKALRAMGDEHISREYGKHLRCMGDELFCEYTLRRLHNLFRDDQSIVPIREDNPRPKRPNSS